MRQRLKERGAVQEYPGVGLAWPYYQLMSFESPEWSDVEPLVRLSSTGFYRLLPNQDGGFR